MLKPGPIRRAVDHGSCVVEDVVEQAAPIAGQAVGRFPALADRKASLVLPFGDVAAAALHEMQREFFAQAAAHLALGCVGQRREFRCQQAKQVVEGGVIPRMRCRGEEHHVPARLAVREAFEKLVALVSGVGVRSHAGVRLVDDDELRASAEEIAAAPVRLDVVEGDDRIGMDLEYRLVQP